MSELLNNLGGTLGFGESSLERNDDSYKDGVDITAVFGSTGLNFFGTQYNYVSVNNNGNITLSNSSYGGLSTYTPFGLATGGYAIIAPFFADVDTRLSTGGVADANQVTPTPGGTSRGSDLVWYDLDSTGYGTLTVTWDDVGYYSYSTDKLNAFQLQIVGQGSGNFDIKFRYESINWTTGDASDGIDGLGGTVARAGYSTGDGASWYELWQSGYQDPILELENTTGNTGVAGFYEFSVRSGTAGADVMNGGGQDDLLAGAAGDDVLYGNGGDDYLIGNAGADTLAGGAGDDTYTTDGLDVIIETSDDGTDTVLSPVSYTLGDNLENLRLTGTDNINGTGNALNNVLTGNSGSNVLDGQDGSDTVDYSVATGGISVDLAITSGQYIPGQSYDTLINIENINGSIFADRLTGTSGANILFGNLGADTLDGGGGDDQLEGGVGDDSLTGGDGSDTAVYTNASSAVVVNLVAGSASGGDGNDTLISIENIRGSEYNDTLTGNSGANILDGNGGADHMEGGAGSDTYHVDNAGDEVIESAENVILLSGPMPLALGSDIDKVIASIDYALGNYVEHLELAGTATTGTGNALDNTLTGNSGNNRLVGGAGNDNIDGNSGTDTAQYSNTLSSYTLTKSGSTYTVLANTGNDGTDTLSNIEKLQFADMTVNLTVQAAADTLTSADLQRLEELYVAFFNRVPDADGLEYWIGQFKAGQTVNQIADVFYSAGIKYSDLTGFSANMSHNDFVNVVYRNVLGRADGADAEGLTYWSGELANGRATHGSLVSTILDSAHTFKGNATWGWVADLLDNKIVVADTFAVDLGLNYNTPEDSIEQGMAIAQAVTPTSTAAALALVGLSPGSFELT